MSTPRDSVPPDEEKGDTPNLNEAQTSHEAAMAEWNKKWAYFYALTLIPDGLSLPDAILACGGGRPLNPDLTFERIVSAWDETLLDNERANPDKGLALTIEQIGPRPEAGLYPDVDIGMHDFRAMQRQRAFHRRETVKSEVPSLKPVAREDVITEPPPQGATRSIPPPDRPRETLPSGLKRDPRRSAVPGFSVPPPPSTGVLGPQGATSDVSTTIPGYLPPVSSPEEDAELFSFEDIDVDDDEATADPPATEGHGFFDVGGDVTKVSSLENLLPAVREPHANLRQIGMNAHALYTLEEARISYPPPPSEAAPPLADDTSPSGWSAPNLLERSVTDAVAAVAMRGSLYSEEERGVELRKSMIRRGPPANGTEEEEELASLGPTTAADMRSKIPPAVEDLERLEQAQADARRKLEPSGRPTLRGMAPPTDPATEALPVAPRVSRPPATPQPAVMARAPTPKPPASDEDVRKLSIHDLGQAATLPPPVAKPPLRGPGPITGNQGYQLTPPRGVQKPIVRPLPVKTLSLVLGVVGIVAMIFAGVITQHRSPTTPVSTTSVGVTVLRAAPVVGAVPPPAPKVCLAQTAFDQLTLAEQNAYFGCRSRRDEAPLFRCQISATATREARLPFCRLVRDTCRILPGVTVTSTQAACLADPIGHAAPAPSP